MAAKTNTPLWHRSLNLLRRADRSVARHVSELVEASNYFSDATKFRVRNTGRRFQEFDATKESVEHAFGGAGKSAGRGGDLPFVLATDSSDPALTLSYLHDPLAVRGAYDRIEIGFDLSRPLVGPGGIFTFPDAMKYTARCVDGFDAATAAIHDSRLFELVATGYTLEMSKSQLPPSQHKYIPIPEIVKITPPELFRRLSRLRHPTSFDLTKVPPAVFWINYWNAEQVKSVGEDRVRSAPWGFIAPHPRGGLLLASQQEEFDALKLEHLERIARIADVLDLYSVQGRKHKV